MARLAIQAKGLDVAVLRVLELVQYTDWFIVASGRSDRHVRAIREHIQDALREAGRKPLSVEGIEHNQWVLLDYGDVVVHIFYEPVREFYELERLWQDAPRLEIKDTDDPAAA
ncbi:MAG: ribosome silencing factor [Deltaproteobacteria bacterium]|nr:MAG: ribosome silencing factor [Deltaproteobacteria bacterium]